VVLTHNLRGKNSLTIRNNIIDLLWHNKIIRMAQVQAGINVLLLTEAILIPQQGVGLADNVIIPQETPCTQHRVLMADKCNTEEPCKTEECRAVAEEVQAEVAAAMEGVKDDDKYFSALKLYSLRAKNTP